MKHSRILGIAVLAILVTLPALAEPAAKQTAQVGDIHIVDASAMAARGVAQDTILSQNLKTSSQKRVFIDVSLECGLYTRTLVKTKGGGQKDTAKAEAGVEISVYVDGVQAAPGTVVFCRRDQTLSAILGQALDGCEDLNGDGTVTILECNLIDQEIELILDTMGAHAFNFISHELSSGMHLIEVKASFTEEYTGDADATATLGKGSLTVEEVRLAVGDDIEL